MGAGYPSDWNQRRKKIYQRDNYTCQDCGEKGGSRGDSELHAHHIVPKSKGGSHKLKNLTTLCKDCHGKRHSWMGATTHRPQKGFWSRMYKSADEELNEFYGGCPNCTEANLTVRWEQITAREEAKVLQCSSCGAMYDERITQDGARQYLELVRVENAEQIEPTTAGTIQEIKRYRIRGRMHSRAQATDIFGSCPTCGKSAAVTLNSILFIKFFKCNSCGTKLRKRILRSEWIMTSGNESDVGSVLPLFEWKRQAREQSKSRDVPEIKN
ncbi:HNH endonuclease [Salinadaptatus halalkaliphilus]|uniref:HNH endonuclease n=2 Tax=Salinadaptatus halalkaliphilus TaxID=2419781 RepID=A0A4S3TJ41_9EURY|nr:HNH endonuclease [Salinadaptatus halalkaliphilus]